MKIKFIFSFQYDERIHDSDIAQSHFRNTITLSSLQGVQINIIFKMRKKSIKFPKFMDGIF